MLLTYLLHGAESFLRSQPVNFAASQEIPRIYGTRRFLTIPTSARHLSMLHVTDNYTNKCQYVSENSH
jgi:hypothetical protein